MYPVIHIFGLELYSFNVCIILAIVVAMLVFIYRTKGIFELTVQDTLIAIFGADIPFVLLGAVLHNKIVYAHSFEEFCNSLWKNTGIAFLGGFIGGLIGFLLLFHFMMKNRIAIKLVMDNVVPSLVLGHAIGRIGCFLGGCCYGKPFFIGVSYGKSSLAYRTYGDATLFPSQLVEAGILFIMFLVFSKIKSRQTELYLLSYSVVRFLLEFLRGDSRGNAIGIFSPAQMICIAMFLVGMGISIWNNGKVKEV